MTVSLAQMSTTTHRGHTFLKFSTDQLVAFIWSQAQFQFFAQKDEFPRRAVFWTPNFPHPLPLLTPATQANRTRKAVFFVVFTTFMIEVFITLKEKNDTISWAKSRLWARSRTTGLSFVRFWFLIIYMKKFIEHDWKRVVQCLVHSSKTRKYNAKKEIKGKFLR